MLKWSEPDLVEYFGVVATFDDGAHSHSFEVSRDGLVLLVTIFDLEQSVYVSLFRDGLPNPVLTVKSSNCTHVHITQSHGFRICFEAGAPEHPVTQMGLAPILKRGVRVYVHPHFQIELIEPNR